MAKGVAVLSLVGLWLLKWAGDELKACLPWCARRFFEVSVRLLPASERERYGEEWHAHLDSFPGTALSSAQFFWAAITIRALANKEALLRRWIAFRTRAVVFGVIVYCYAAAQLSRFGSLRKPVIHEASVENSKWILALLVMVVAFAWLKQGSEPYPSGTA
ncbi:MAG: hypothetical protein ACLGSD_00365 [Acidobacteriota bacterium]